MVREQQWYGKRNANTQNGAEHIAFTIALLWQFITADIDAVMLKVVPICILLTWGLGSFN